MKKLLIKDKKRRAAFKKLEFKNFVLKQVFKNSNLTKTIRWNASRKLSEIMGKNSKVSIVKFCPKTIHKKSFHKLTLYSRHVFLKLARAGKISYLKKSTW